MPPRDSVINSQTPADTPPPRSQLARYRRSAMSALSNCRSVPADGLPESHRWAGRSSCRRQPPFCLWPPQHAEPSGPASTPHRAHAVPWSRPRLYRSLSGHSPQGTPAPSGNWFNRGDGTSIRSCRTWFILSFQETAVSAFERGLRCPIPCRRAAAWCADAAAWREPPVRVPALPPRVRAP